jgi:hypothetical protein
MEQCFRSTGQTAFHPVRFRYPNEITKAFHGAGRTGGINLMADLVFLVSDL